jgi:hypothetical protein
MTNDSLLIYEAYLKRDENNESIPPVVRSLSDILASKGSALHNLAPTQDVGNEEVRTTTNIATKTLMANIFNDPNRFWDLLKKTPGMYAALLTGNVNQLNNIFKSLGVDVPQISNAVKKSMELFAEYQRGTPVEVRKAVAANPLRATPVK